MKKKKRFSYQDVFKKKKSTVSQQREERKITEAWNKKLKINTQNPH